MSKYNTVSVLNSIISTLVKSDETYHVKGELSNFKISGVHGYMSLKDNTCSVRCVCFNMKNKFSNICNELSDGDMVLIDGKLDYYSRFGTLQILINNIQKLEEKGNVYTEYQQLKEKCKNKGYFNEDIKKTLPNTINKIGVITSKHGDAIKDFISVISKWGYNKTIHVEHCNVQGVNCPSTVSKAINKLDKLDFDVIVITRGGGSFEDLFGFSDIKIIKSIYKAKTCIISAIGHEADFMLSDFVADLRGSTPSVAAEILGEHINSNNILTEYQNYYQDKYSEIENTINEYKSKLLQFEHNILFGKKKIIDEYKNYISTNRMEILNICSTYSSKISELKNTIDKSNMYKVFDINDNPIDINKLDINDTIKIISDGMVINATINGINNY